MSDIKALMRSIDNAYSNTSPNGLSIPLPNDLLQQIQSFKTNTNNDVNLIDFQSPEFSDKLYDIYSKYCADNEDNQVSFFLILSMLSDYIIDFKSLLYWINECLSNAVNSPGVKINIVVISRFFLRSILVSGKDESNSKETEEFGNVRIINACKLFKILLNLYMTDNLLFYEKGYRMNIVVDNSFNICTEVIKNKGEVESKYNKTDNLTEKTVLESHEAKRFINLNLRKLLVDFMISKPEISGEIFNEYLQNKETRFHTLSLLNALINNDSNSSITANFFTDSQRDILDSPLSILTEAIYISLQPKTSAKSSKLLQRSTQNIYNNNLKLDLKKFARTRIFESISKCLLFDNDIMVIQAALLSFIILLPQIESKLLNETIPLILLVYIKLVSWNENLNMFFDFKINELTKLLDDTIFLNIIFHDEKLIYILKKIQPLSKDSDGQIEKLNRIWKSFSEDTNNLRFDYSSMKKLYTVIYGLFPNTLISFMKSPTEFILKTFNFNIKEFIQEEHIHIFNENDVLYNSKQMVSGHLMNQDVLMCTIDDEINSPGNLSWYQQNLSGNNLLWHCLRLDKDIDMKFCYPQSKEVDINIFKLLLTNDKKKSNINNNNQINTEGIALLFRLIDEFRVENFGFRFNGELYRRISTSSSGSNNNIIGTENPDLSNSHTDKHKTCRKQSIVSLSSDSNTADTNGISNDFNSILSKQEQLYSDVQIKENKNKEENSLARKSSISNSLAGNTNSHICAANSSLRASSRTNSPLLDATSSLAGTQDEKSLSLSLTNDLNNSYYKRELYLMVNEYQFLSMVMSMCNTELQRYKELKFDGFLDKTQQNRLQLLKREDAAFQRKNLGQVYKNILKEYSLLYRTSINAVKDRDKIKLLRGNVSKLEDEKIKMKNMIKTKNKEIAELDSKLKEKDTTITQLMHTIRYLKEITKVDENLERSNELEKQTILFKDYNKELVSNSEDINCLEKEIIKLRNEIESLKILNKCVLKNDEKTKKEQKSFKSNKDSFVLQKSKLDTLKSQIKELANKNQDLIQIIKQKNDIILKLSWLISKNNETWSTNTKELKNQLNYEACEKHGTQNLKYVDSLKRKLSKNVQSHIEVRARDLFSEDNEQHEDEKSANESKKNSDTKVFENRLYFTTSHESSNDSNRASTQVSNNFVIIDNHT